MVFFFIDVTYISLRFYVIDPVKSSYLLICCLINVVLNVSAFLLFQWLFFHELFERLLENMFRVELVLIYSLMIAGSLNFSYIYDVLLRRYYKDDLLYIKEILNVKKHNLILKEFLKKWFNRSKKQYFPKILYSIYKIKNLINPILLDLTYPMDLFDGDHTIQGFFPDFSNKFIANTYIFMNMFAFKRNRVQLVLLFITMVSGFAISRYLSHEKVFIVDFVFLMFVALIDLYVVHRWTLSNGLERFMKSIVVLLNVITSISFIDSP